VTAIAFVTGLVLFVIGAGVDVVAGVDGPWRRATPYVLAVVGSVAETVAGVRAMGSGHTTLNLTTVVGIGHSGLLLDHLAGVFLTLLFFLGTAVSINFVGWSRRRGPAHRRGVASGYLLLLTAVALVIAAADVFTFLFAWELLSVSFYVLTAVSRERASQATSAWLTGAVSKFGGAALLVAFLILSSHSGSLMLSSWHSVAPGATVDSAWILIVVGFGAKLGVVPFQVWLPVGYPSAPSPARAAMAGIAANVAVYGLWRCLGVLAPPAMWIVVTVLLVGGVTALLGVAFAGVQSGLNRVIAYSSVENAGLIMTAYGVALTGRLIHVVALTAVGLLAASLQVVTHALAKSTLFIATSAFEADGRGDDLDDLRGVGRRMKWSGSAFAIGALSLAGLPPTIGFVSEWFILEALMQQFRVASLTVRLSLGIAAALVALTTGLAALVFLRVLALTILGPRSTSRPLHEPSWYGAFAAVALALTGLALAVVSPLEVRVLARGLSSIVPVHSTLGALRSPWVLQPVFSGFSILSPSWLWVVLPAAIVAVTLGALLLSRGGLLRIRRSPSWHSGAPATPRPAAYTAFGFANPLRHVLGNVLGTKRATQTESLPLTAPGVISRERVVEPVETYLYRPVTRATLAVADVVKRLQSGRLNAYVAYMLVAILALFAIIGSVK
jgi:formate hydrogenlyase subunit 3/multisubunit Na+/H+ antiporter MnhD subunit